MYRMAYYLTYETRNVLEYQDLDEKAKEKETFSDHPETELREKRLAQMMTDYGCGHVTVKDRKTVCLDGQELLSVDWTRDDYDNTVENAYYVAGGLAKAFHDYDSLAGWDFRPDGEGGLDFLTDDRVYGRCATSWRLAISAAACSSSWQRLTRRKPPRGRGRR